MSRFDGPVLLRQVALVGLLTFAAFPREAAAQIWYTPTSFDFGEVALGQTATQTVTITNVGTSPLTGWAGGAVSAPFNASQDCNISGGLPPGGSCHYFFTFSPTTAGVFTATSSSSTSGGAITITVKGTGAGPRLWVNPLSVDLGRLVPGGSAAQTVTITNQGASPLTGWAGGAVSAPFSGSQDCNVTGGLLPGASCHYFFTFAPTTLGTYTTSSISSTNGGSITVGLAGACVKAPIFIGAPPTVNPLSVDFGEVPIGTAGTQQPVTVTNNNTSSLTSWAGGGVPAPFGGSQDCNVTGGLPSGASCHFYYTFQPTSPGVFTATSTVSTSSGSFSVVLRGTGVGPKQWVTPLGFDFGPVAVGTSLQQAVTITNIGRVPISGWAGGAVAAPFSASQDCNVTGGLLPGASCHFFYVFTPTTTGTFTTTSIASTNAGPFSISIAGEAVNAPPHVAAAFAPTTVAVGGTTTLDLTITNPNASTSLSGVGVSAAYSPQMSIAASPPAQASAGCGAGSLLATPGTGMVTFSGGSLSGGATCQITVPTVAAAAGSFTITTSVVTSLDAGAGNAASASLAVGSTSASAAGDCNGDGVVTPADDICFLNFMFLGGAPPR